MSTFDPTTVRKAVEEFTPRRPQKFQDLLPAKEVIAELRQKGASYRSIADLLTQHCLPISKTAIAVFCHQVLGETVRPRKRPGRKRSSATPDLGDLKGASYLPQKKHPAFDRMAEDIAAILSLNLPDQDAFQYLQPLLGFHLYLYGIETANNWVGECRLAPF